MQELFIGLVTNKAKSASWIESYLVSNRFYQTDVSFKIETGAEANILPLNIAQKVMSWYQT